MVGVGTEGRDPFLPIHPDCWGDDCQGGRAQLEARNVRTHLRKISHYANAPRASDRGFW